MNLTLAAKDGRNQPRDEGRAESPLAVRGLTVSYGEKPAVFSVDATFRAGAMTAIVGPNGAGKSTLLKAALGIVRPLSGKVTCYGKPLAKQRGRIAYVPQRASVDWDFPTRVIDVVLMGLYRQLGLLGRIIIGVYHEKAFLIRRSCPRDDRDCRADNRQCTGRSTSWADDDSSI